MDHIVICDDSRILVFVGSVTDPIFNPQIFVSETHPAPTFGAAAARAVLGGGGGRGGPPLNRGRQHSDGGDCGVDADAGQDVVFVVGGRGGHAQALPASSGMDLFGIAIFSCEQRPQKRLVQGDTSG